MFQCFISLLGYSHCKILQVISTSLFMSLAEIYFSLLFFSGYQGDVTGAEILMKQGIFFFISLSWGSFELIGYFFSLMSKCPFHVSLFHSCTFHSSLNTEQKLAIPKVNSKFIVSWEVYKLEFLGKSYIFFQRIII